MFEEISRHRAGKPATRRLGYLAASAVLQLLCLAVLILATGQRHPAALGGLPLVPVKLIRPAPSPTAMPPPPPLAAGPRPSARPSPVPPILSPAPEALLQPREIPAPLPAPEPEPEPAGTSSASDGTGGVAEGTPGGVAGGTVGGPGQPPGDGAGESVWALPGGRARGPTPAESDCVLKAMRIPASLLAFVSGVIKVEFEVRPDGTTDRFQTVTAVPDDRIAQSIRQAIASCRWVPAIDQSGQPTSIRLKMPLRFKGG